MILAGLGRLSMKDGAYYEGAFVDDEIQVRAQIAMLCQHVQPSVQVAMGDLCETAHTAGRSLLVKVLLTCTGCLGTGLLDVHH